MQPPPHQVDCQKDDLYPAYFPHTPVRGGMNPGGGGGGAGMSPAGYAHGYAPYMANMQYMHNNARFILNPQQGGYMMGPLQAGSPASYPGGCQMTPNGMMFRGGHMGQSNNSFNPAAGYQCHNFSQSSLPQQFYSNNSQQATQQMMRTPPQNNQHHQQQYSMQMSPELTHCSQFQQQPQQQQPARTQLPGCSSLMPGHPRGDSKHAATFFNTTSPSFCSTGSPQQGPQALLHSPPGTNPRTSSAASTPSPGYAAAAAKPATNPARPTSSSSSCAGSTTSFDSGIGLSLSDLDQNPDLFFPAGGGHADHDRTTSVTDAHLDACCSLLSESSRELLDWLKLMCQQNTRRCGRPDDHDPEDSRMLLAALIRQLDIEALLALPSLDPLPVLS